MSMTPEIIDQVRQVSSRELSRGEIVFLEGDLPDDTMFFLLTGEIGIYKNRPDGEKMINQLGPGSFFGEMALVGQRPRLATAKVISDNARIAILTRDVFLKLCGKSPQFLFNLLKYAVSRLIAAEDKLQRIKEEVQNKKKFGAR